MLVICLLVDIFKRFYCVSAEIRHLVGCVGRRDEHHKWSKVSSAHHFQGLYRDVKEEKINSVELGRCYTSKGHMFEGGMNSNLEKTILEHNRCRIKIYIFLKKINIL